MGVLAGTITRSSTKTQTGTATHVQYRFATTARMTTAICVITSTIVSDIVVGVLTATITNSSKTVDLLPSH